MPVAARFRGDQVDEHQAVRREILLIQLDVSPVDRLAPEDRQSEPRELIFPGQSVDAVPQEPPPVADGDLFLYKPIRAARRTLLL